MGLGTRLKNRRVVVRYGGALAVTFLAIAAAVPLDPLIPTSHYPFLLPVLAVLVSAWWGGLGPSLTSLVVSPVGLAYFVLPPVYSLRIASPADQLAVGLSMATGLGVAVIAQSLSVARRRAALHARRAQRQYQALLRESQWRRIEQDARLRLAAIVESSEDAVIGKTLDGVVTSWNRGAEQIYGYTAEEMIGTSIARLIPPERKEELPRILEQLRRGQPVKHYQTVRVRKDAQPIQVSIAVSPIRDAEGRIVGASATARDISEQVRREERLRDSELRYRAIFEAALDGIITINERGLIESLNPAAERLFGYSADEILGRSIALLMPEAEAVKHDLYLANYRADGNRTLVGTGREVAGRRRDGSLVALDLAVSEVTLGDRRLFIGLVHDVTERKRAAEESRRAQQAAEEANQAKSDFLANVSHELRTPMNAVLGMTELALGDELPAQARSYLNTVQESAEALLGLLDSLLDFSRLEAGRVVLENTAFNLEDLVRSIVKALSVSAHQKGLALRCHLDHDVPRQLTGDAGLLRQVLWNLAANAVKFTERGHVAIRVELESQTADGVCLRFSVCDTGIGIPATQQRRIFAPFTQIDASRTRRYGGTGLGLSIVASLARLMGGKVWVQSKEGQGSTFFFTAPLARNKAVAETRTDRRPAGPARSEGAAGGRGLRILLAEDTRANQRLIVAILAKRGHRVDVASNGREAVTLAHQGDYDAVLMDVQMPVMDGFQATAAIRSMAEQAKSRIPIVALTAHAMRADRQRCLGYGMDAYLSKPVDAQQLVELVERLAAREPPSPIDSTTAAEINLLASTGDTVESNLKDTAASVPRTGAQQAAKHS